MDSRRFPHPYPWHLLAAGLLALSPITGLEAEATLRVGAGVAAPGQPEASVPISMDLDPAEGLVTGMELTVRYDPSVLGGVAIVPVENVDFYRHLDQSTYEDAGNVGAAIIWDLFGSGGGVHASGVVASLTFCVLDTAAAGNHEVEILPSAERRVEGRLVIASVYTAAHETRIPILEAGRVTVAGDPVPGGSCPADDREPPPPPPPPPPRPDVLKAAYKLEDASAHPGGTFSLPFAINGNGEVSGFSFSVDFDEGLVQASSVEDVFQKPDGSEYEFRRVVIDNADATPGNAGVDEGFIVGAVIFDFDSDSPPAVLPRDVDTRVHTLHFTVSEEAPAAVTEVRFLDGAQFASSSPPTRNVVTMFFESVLPDEQEAQVSIDTFKNALISIVGDASAFVRGDSNGDGTVNISDSVHTLGFLFLGGPPPICFDAADANDDGHVNIADPIRTLGFLFLGDEALPLPAPGQPDQDPTPDAMTCLTGSL